MSNNNLEDQTNPPLLSQDRFDELYNPKLEYLAENGKFTEITKTLADVIRTNRMEPDLRMQLILGIALAQFHEGLKFQQEQMALGAKIGEQIGMTEVEKETAKATLLKYAKDFLAKKEQQNG